MSHIKKNTPRGALCKDVPPAKRLFSANNCVKRMSKASALLIFYALFSRKIVSFVGALQFLKCKFFAKAKPQAAGSLPTVKDCQRSISENLPSKTDTSLRRAPHRYGSFLCPAAKANPVQETGIALTQTEKTDIIGENDTQRRDFYDDL